MYFFLQKTYNYESTHDIIHLNGRTAQNGDKNSIENTSL